MARQQKVELLSYQGVETILGAIDPVQGVLVKSGLARKAIVLFACLFIGDYEHACPVKFIVFKAKESTWSCYSLAVELKHALRRERAILDLIGTKDADDVEFLEDR